VKKFGPICAESDGGSRTWSGTLGYCTKYGLRLPTLSEALVLARKYVVAGLSSGDAFWTDENLYSGGSNVYVVIDFGDGTYEFGGQTPTSTFKTVCVTDPSAGAGGVAGNVTPLGWPASFFLVRGLTGPPRSETFAFQAVAGFADQP
jgi:hypothetical protein